ncbi:sugar transferase, partial [Candidatus Poribacteria bacterium]|nr:sugar transferase [Candidatus Poribacteria bacterium]
MPFLSRSIDQIGKDADETSRRRAESLTASFSPQTSPKIPKTGTLVERLSSFYAKRGKHLFDAIAAFFLIIIFAPLMGLIAILIKLTSSGSVFFSHKRVGLNNELFIMHKFRSLHDDTP